MTILIGGTILVQKQPFFGYPGNTCTQWFFKEILFFGTTYESIINIHFKTI